MGGISHQIGTGLKGLWVATVLGLGWISAIPRLSLAAWRLRGANRERGPTETRDPRPLSPVFLPSTLIAITSRNRAACSSTAARELIRRTVDASRADAPGARIYATFSARLLDAASGWRFTPSEVLLMARTLPPDRVLSFLDPRAAFTVRQLCGSVPAKPSSQPDAGDGGTRRVLQLLRSRLWQTLTGEHPTRPCPKGMLPQLRIARECVLLAVGANALDSAGRDKSAQREKYVRRWLEACGLSAPPEGGQSGRPKS